MLAFIFDNLDQALSAVLNEMIVLVVRAGVLVWGVIMGRVLGVGFYDINKPYKHKVLLLSMPASILLSMFFAFWSYKGCVNPGETKAEALYDAQFTFWCVLIPLWSGCIWGLFKHPDLKKKQSYKYL